MAKPKQSGESKTVGSQFHFTVGRTSLLRELLAVTGAIEKKSTIPILSNLRMEAGDGTLKLAGTNLDISLETKCEADVHAAGALCINGAKLLGIVKLAAEGEMEFKCGDNKQVTIKAGNAKFKLAGLPADNFPELLSVDGPVMELPAANLRRILNRTRFAITKEESRYTLNGAKLEIANGNVRMIATDGHRLAYAEFNAELGDHKVDCLIPAKALGELAGLLADLKEDAKALVSVNAAQIMVEMGKRRLIARRLTGQFPDYKMVLPKDNKLRVPIKVADLMGALRRVKLMADERSHAIRLRFAADKTLFVVAPATEQGDASESLSVEYDGPEIEAAFNADYLEEGLEAIGDEAVIKLKDGNSQTEFVPAAGDDFRYIVMPMRL
jgi:DNA polymerase III subunit beta